MSRLTIDISPEQHQSLKALAALQGKTIRQYALERLFPAGDTATDAADEQSAWDELKAVLVERIENFKPSGRSVDAIVDAGIARAKKG